MSGKFLIDTNIVIALFAEDASVQRHIAVAEEIFIPATVIGELFSEPLIRHIKKKTYLK